MLVLKIIGGLAVLCLFGGLIKLFNDVCEEKFSYKFFTTISCVTAIAATWLTYMGLRWYWSASASGGDVLNGILIMVIGVGIAIGLIVYNFKKTNLAYGFFGTLAQLGIFVPLAFVGSLVLVVAAFVGILCAFATRTVYVKK